MVRAAAINRMKSGLRSADTTEYIKPRCRTEIGKRAFLYACPLAWNDLPLSLHCTTDSNVLGIIKNQIALLIRSSTYRNACLNNYVRQAILLSLLLLLLLLLLKNTEYAYKITITMS